MTDTLRMYRDKIKNMDGNQLQAEFENVLDQLEQVRAGTREEVDWPYDSKINDRPREIKLSGGRAVPAKPIVRVTKYWNNGSPKEMLDSNGAQQHHARVGK